MANKYLNNNFEECTIYRCPEYLYIDDVENFLEDCSNEYISEGVDKPGVYQWSDDFEAWFIANPNIEKKVREIVKQNSSCHENNNENVKWYISVILDSGLCVEINSEPVSMDKVPEIIDTLLKPCFFGKRIKKFEIVAG